MSKLSDIQVRNWIKNDERFDAKSDGGGLYLRYRQEDAIPIWRFRYRFAGKQRVMNLGSYGQVSLAGARKLAKGLRAKVALGYDVAAEKRNAKPKRWRRSRPKNRPSPWHNWPMNISRAVF